MQYDKYHNYKRFVSVDCVIFGYEQERLKLLVFKRAIEPAKGKWSLIGGWVKEEESVEDAARRVLHDITGLKDVFLEQVQTFSKPQRDPGGNVLTIAFYAMIKVEKHSNELINEFGAQWISLPELPPLIFDHDQMVQRALEKLRLKASYEMIGRQLLPEKFTITNLRNLYSEIFQKQFDPGNFRKKVLSLKILHRLDEKDMSESRKGAFYYKFRDIEEVEFVDPIFKRSI
ncbi:NUDIX domain-containing protein [Marinilabiliaceae bacterium JC017]|nr:NUDIX domain-containing protein [Marinilabiliaceae bacterium JC017]